MEKINKKILIIIALVLILVTGIIVLLLNNKRQNGFNKNKENKTELNQKAERASTDDDIDEINENISLEDVSILEQETEENNTQKKEDQSLNKNDSNSSKENKKSNNTNKNEEKILADVNCSTKWVDNGNGVKICKQIPYCDKGYTLRDEICEQYVEEPTFEEEIFCGSASTYDKNLKKCIQTAVAEEKCYFIGTPYIKKDGKCYTNETDIEEERCPSGHFVYGTCFATIMSADFICKNDMTYNENLKKCVKYFDPIIAKEPICSDGLLMNENNKCVTISPPKFKDAISYECPKGYTFKFEDETPMCYKK